MLGLRRNPVTCLAAPGEGRLLAAGGQDGRVSLWHAAGDAPSALLEAHATAVAHMAVSGDGMLLATAGGDGTVGCGGCRTGC